ncbi:MAG: leucyl/phenylalanyl-tRNA--protein transferase, partial [Steroidobacteraceae bacterium]
MNNLIWLSENDPPDSFPSVDQALIDPPGLLAAGGDLSSARLLAAYRRGIFPWYSPGQPILWWSPDPRTVLFPQEFKASRSLSKTARQRSFSIRVNCAFAAVLAGCADPQLRPDGTWITPAMQGAYLQLHQQGHAHSVETWCDDQLVGGLYGVKLGTMFFGESMFSRISDASKFALKSLCEPLAELPVALFDCQMA